MVGWSAQRRALYVLAFTGFTILGLLIFNVYPTLLNTYTSFTNRNKFHPYPDCTNSLNNIVVPYCWESVFDIPKAGIPFTFVDPLFDNYAKITGGIFSINGLANLFLLVACIIPLIVVYQIDKREDRKLDRKFPSWLLWTLGLVVAFLILGLFGLNAWKELTTSGDFWAVVFRTIAFVILRVPFTFVLGLLMALIVTSPGLPGKNIWRVILFIPWAASSVAILTSLVWKFFFQEQGTINQMLDVIFNIKGPVWLNDPLYAFGIIILVDIWYSYPFFMVAILGATASIPNESYEAADIDGASYWQQLRKITLPLIRPAILPALVLTSISAFQMFGTVWAITQGGPTSGAGKPGATELVLVYGYKQIFQSQNYGTATAFATIIFIMLFAAVLYSMRLTRITRGAYE